MAGPQWALEMAPTPHALTLSKSNSAGVKITIDTLPSAPLIHRIPYSKYVTLAYRNPTSWTLIFTRFESEALVKAAMSSLSKFHAL